MKITPDPQGPTLPNKRGAEHAPLGWVSHGVELSAGRVTAGGTWFLNVGNHTPEVAIFFKNYRL